MFVYDGSFLGFLTVVFQGYKSLENEKIIDDSREVPFFETSFFVATDRKLASRVKTSLIKTFGNNFFSSITLAFHSYEEDKEETIAKTIKGMYKNGYNYLKSSNEAPVNFNRIIKNILSENHDFKGLLRFEELDDGSLYARFRPKNDILDLIYPHFKNRMPKEKFIIHDVGRNICIIYENGIFDYMELEEVPFSKSSKEDFYSKAWQAFYNSIAIKERENKKLMQSNMPKYKWEFLTEKKK